jgi:hypothetical protein
MKLTFTLSTAGARLPPGGLMALAATHKRNEANVVVVIDLEAKIAALMYLGISTPTSRSL